MASIIKRLKTELNIIITEIGRLQKQADGLRLTIEYLESKDKTTQIINATSGPGRPKRPPSEGPSELVRQMIDILEINGDPMHYRDIYKELIHRGVPIGGQDPVRNVSAHISLNKAYFKSMGQGYWALNKQDSDLSSTEE